MVNGEWGMGNESFFSLQLLLLLSIQRYAYTSILTQILHINDSPFTKKAIPHEAGWLF